jgi:hypothetical protein
VRGTNKGASARVWMCGSVVFDGKGGVVRGME